MADVDIELIGGANASHHILQGWAITKVAIVSGLDEATTHELMQSAVAAVEGITGPRGSACPDIDVPTYLEQFIPEVVTTEEVRVRIIYKGYTLPTFEFGGSLEEVETNLEIDGATPITVQYDYPVDYTLDPTVAGQTIVQGGMVSRQIPIPTFTIRWLVTDGTIDGDPHTATEMMSWFEATYMGKVNDADYTIGMITGHMREWLCSAVNGVSRDGGATYEAAMTFQYRKGTWDKLVTFIDPQTGKPPQDLVVDVGYMLEQVFEVEAFPTFYFGPN